MNIFKWLKYSLGFGSICFAFSFGYALSYSSWDDSISISRHKSLYSRGLASEGGEAVIETVPSSFLDPQSLFDKARVFLEEDQVGFYVGNIIAKDLKGNKNFACDVYSQVHFYFEAHGVFNEGEPITMMLHSSCKTGESIHSIGPFFIPAQEILNSPFSRKTFTTKDGNIYFNNVALFWPKEWILMEVTFQSASLDLYRVRAKIPQNENEKFFTIQF